MSDGGDARFGGPWTTATWAFRVLPYAVVGPGRNGGYTPEVMDVESLLTAPATWVISIFNVLWFLYVT
ncbi:MAG TPA: hypothetical protein VMU54_14910, partial [Planctomycetota bacterium]|nr:hypothetical protein [Planctomycetota bacterium]